MEVETGEEGDAAGGNNDGDAGVVAEVAHEVVGAFLLDVLDPGAHADAGEGHEVDGAVFLGHVVEGAPAGEVGFVVGKADVAGVLVPTEFHAGLGAFDDILLPEEPGVLPEGGAADGGHEAAEEEFAEDGLAAEAVGDEVAAAAVADADGVGAFAVHAGLDFVDEVLALVPQELEVFGGDDVFEDHVAVLAELVDFVLRDIHRIKGSSIRR